MSGDFDALLPRHVLCVLGLGLDFDAAVKVAVGAGGPGFSLDEEYSEQDHDPRMPHAFEASQARASFTDADWDAVANHDSVAYILSRAARAFTMPPELAPKFLRDTSREALAVTAALLRSGATAVKNESSGITHGRDRWLSLADEAAAASTEDELAGVLYRAWVKRPISSGELLYSCGMHLLGAPDVELEVEAAPTTNEEVEECVTLLDALAIYLLTDERAAEISDGEGFRLAEDAPRWVLHHHPCDRYDSDDIFFNPYGSWRLTPA